MRDCGVPDVELAESVVRRRFRAQLLTGAPADHPVDVVERITAVQAQDRRAFRLAIRARTQGLTASDLDRCLTQERSLVVDWLNRGTLHLVRAEDHAWLHALTTPQLTVANERRLRQEGVSPWQAEHGIAVLERSLATHGPLTRAAARELLDSADVPTARQALVHVLFAASLRGVCVRGPVIDGDQAFVHRVDWLGPQAPVDLDQALGELARRFLAGHGPADERDLARWAGFPLGRARTAMRSSGAAVVEGSPGLLALRSEHESDADDVPPPRLLGAFDPLLHGWVSRRPVLGPHEWGVVTTNGVFRPIALVDGRAVATWGLSAGRVTTTALPGERLDSEVTTRLEDEAVDVLRFLGATPA